LTNSDICLFRCRLPGNVTRLMPATDHPFSTASCGPSVTPQTHLCGESGTLVHVGRPSSPGQLCATVGVCQSSDVRTCPQCESRNGFWGRWPARVQRQTPCTTTAPQREASSTGLKKTLGLAGCEPAAPTPRLFGSHDLLLGDLSPPASKHQHCAKQQQKCTNTRNPQGKRTIQPR
jgi:hypothetical protein